MSGIFGILGFNDTDRVFVSTVGQRVVYDAITQLLSEYNRDLNAALSLFVSSTTEDFKFRYKLPGGGYLQRRGGQAPSAAVKRTGSWDVALPLEDFGAAMGGDRVSLAYMSMQELNAHLDTIMIQNTNTVRMEVLKALFDNVAYTFADPLQGNLSVVPLANGDSVVYPPVVGSDTEATDDHYLESGYAAASISDTNNPLKTIRAELIQHFGGPQTGNEPVIAFVNSAQRDQISGLTDFVDVSDRWVKPGDDTATLFGLPPNVPGRVIGRSNGVWVAEWDWIPANYIYGQHLEAPAPLAQRVDPANTGLPRGLALVSQSDPYPLQDSQYANRFGLAVVNRLNGVCFELGTGGTYSIPSGYSH